MRTVDRITTSLLPEWIKQFNRRNEDYRGAEEFELHRVLGVKGQFNDIWRKCWKLKIALWDGKPLTGEQPREVLLDMIGHCFLALALLDEEREADGPDPECPAESGCGDGFHTYQTSTGCLLSVTQRGLAP